MRLVPDPLQELDPGQFAIGIAGPIEQMDLEKHAPFRLHRRAGAETGNAWQ
jgi:hypothetical protein